MSSSNPSDRGKIVAFVSAAKGGVGKTGSAVHLAGALAKKGKTVAIVDTDTGSTAENTTGTRLAYLWTCSREKQIEMGADLNSIKGFMMSPEEKIHKQLFDLSKQYDYVILDTPGYATTALRSAIGIADLSYIPMNCTFGEYYPCDKLINLIKEVEEVFSMQNPDFKIDARILPCRIPGNWRMKKDEFYDWYMSVASNVVSISGVNIPFMKKISDSMGQGWSLHDIGDSKRASFDFMVREIDGELEPFKKRIS